MFASHPLLIGGPLAFSSTKWPMGVFVCMCTCVVGGYVCVAMAVSERVCWSVGFLWIGPRVCCARVCVCTCVCMYVCGVVGVFVWMWLVCACMLVWVDLWHSYLWHGLWVRVWVSGELLVERVLFARRVSWWVSGMWTWVWMLIRMWMWVRIWKVFGCGYGYGCWLVNIWQILYDMACCW